MAEAAALEPAGFFGFKSGPQGDGLGGAGTLDGVADFLAAAEDDVLGDGLERSCEAVDLDAVDGDDVVSQLETGFLRRAVGDQEADLGGGDKVGGLADLPDQHGGKQGEQDGEKRTGEGDDDLVQRSDGRERLGILGSTFKRFHGSHLRQGHKSAGGNPAEAVLDAVDFLFPNRGAEPDLEPVDP